MGGWSHGVLRRRIGAGAGALVALGSAPALVLSLASGPAQAAPQTDQFDCVQPPVEPPVGPGSLGGPATHQVFTVPANVTSVTIDATGGGGGGTFDGFGVPGLGGHAKATLSVTPGDVLLVDVGCAGQDSPDSPFVPGVDGPYPGGAGGFPFGGHGGSATQDTDSGGGGGGGLSRVFLNSESNLVVVAGGGGGAGGSRGDGVFDTGAGGNGGAPGDGIAGEPLPRGGDGGKNPAAACSGGTGATTIGDPCGTPNGGDGADGAGGGISQRGGGGGGGGAGVQGGAGGGDGVYITDTQTGGGGGGSSGVFAPAVAMSAHAATAAERVGTLAAAPGAVIIAFQTPPTTTTTTTPTGGGTGTGPVVARPIFTG